MHHCFIGAYSTNYLLFVFIFVYVVFFVLFIFIFAILCLLHELFILHQDHYYHLRCYCLCLIYGIEVAGN